MAFKDKVYSLVKKIPRGKTKSYSEIAKLAGRPKAWRLVGSILNKNKNPNVPCHRIIRSDGFLAGYNKGLRKKERLLKKEGVKIEKGRVVH